MNIEDWSKFSSSESEDEESPENQPILQNINYIIPNICSSSVLYSYLVDTKKHKYNSQKELLQYWKYIHNSVLSHLHRLDLAKKSPDSCLVSAYLKSRHNHFSALMLLSIGVSNEIGTDVDMTKYGSNKTPDFLYEDEYEIKIIEFTVGRDKNRIEYQKSNSFMGGKYDELSHMIQEYTTKKVSYNLYYLVLGQEHKSNWKDLKNQFTVNEEFESSLIEFDNICLDNYYVISPHIYLSKVDKYVVNDKIKEVYEDTFAFLDAGVERPKLLSIVNVNGTFFEILEKCKNTITAFFSKKRSLSIMRIASRFRKRFC